MAVRRYQDYLDKNRLPHMWCPGCGDGIILRAYTEALVELDLAPKEVVTVTGIGCWGKADDYLTTQAFHGTHGRALAFATGIKLANPDLHVVTLMGDGDAVTIGGNHFIHAARRNIDLTAIVTNNYNYGMTGGQYSATTPLESKTTTSPKGTPEPGFNVCLLAEAAGANFVARTTAYHATALKNLIKEAITHKGFSLVEVISPCPTYFGRFNGNSSAVNMFNWLKDSAVPISKYGKMTAEEQAERFAVGTLVKKERPDFYTTYRRIHRASQQPKGGE
ncbi:2-oxoacid:ferredoxin oxidoreductase subunit beta [Desulfosporosinus sp.]|uniref:2-oxoacid:ferredoxin oxidoreductase subunit beta n=1 Tax=Desulfosporosinus sp. TaxID=157907 RepID=UPI0025BADC49|nr:2-oxoacid:ferredoxin oxidoreductase subunit beta [Desulfosporosinus sp.]MBC2722243.1 2-oxoacid:ferredoxin oxidoreductase subunit beta [Desulfosporosinus sp.]MBC2725199.1 2-oxoacid:ferredoxin oxidoreductase subunit beta [Desulfosporosinus sp.]